MRYYNLLTKFGVAMITSIGLVTATYADENNIAEPFRGDTANAEFTINYDDLDIVLKSSVLLVGKSNRSLAKASTANIGTRMKNNINRLTANEGNRFYFEGFKAQEQQQLLTKIRQSLAQLPSEVPLKYFSKQEQLAYWLNLYNVTILSELVKIYPESSLEDFLTGADSILDKKLLTVADIELSLNDIQYQILMEKYNQDPLLLYGLYQGIVGGPNIRKHAYTGENVYRTLKANANEFINSNRGTYANQKNYFRVSSLYDRNKVYFPDFTKDLTQHLLTYLDGYTRRELQDSTKLKANIDDWKINDVFGSMRSFGGGNATNNAALQDSIANNAISSGREGSGSGVGVADLAKASTYMLKKSLSFGRFTPEQAVLLKALNQRRTAQSGEVSVTDLPSEQPASAEQEN
jgi:hypothetical protein